LPAVRLGKAQQGMNAIEHMAIAGARRLMQMVAHPRSQPAS
jgi:hypothetical protein